MILPAVPAVILVGMCWEENQIETPFLFLSLKLFGLAAQHVGS